MVHQGLYSHRHKPRRRKKVCDVVVAVVGWMGAGRPDPDGWVLLMERGGAWKYVDDWTGQRSNERGRMGEWLLGEELAEDGN